MKDQFYIVLPSNSSMQYFPDNTTTHYITQLPQPVRLQGTWSVAITEIQVPLTFQHIVSEEDRTVHMIITPEIPSEKSNPETIEYTVDDASFLHPGVYKSIESLIEEINSLYCVKDHLKFHIERGGYTAVRRICAHQSCSEMLHSFFISRIVRKILGFDYSATDLKPLIVDKDKILVSVRPSNLSNCLPDMLMVYTDICEPYVTGDVQTRLLRAVSLNSTDYRYGGVRIKTFSSPMYIPILFNNFQTVEIDIRDQQGNPIAFDSGTLTLTLDFRRQE